MPDRPCWIPTFTGRRVELRWPRREQFDICDIAHALSQICRWGGHTRVPYSVAQHSCLVAGLVPPEFALHGLLHDAAEAYVGDMVSPLKEHIIGFGYAERNLQIEIYKKYGVKQAPRSLRAVTLADMTALATEARDLFEHLPALIAADADVRFWIEHLPKPLAEPIRPWSPLKAEGRFLELFLQLTPENPDCLAAVREMAEEDPV